MDENNDIHECKARGRFRKDNVKPLPGDNVEFDPESGEGYGFIKEIDKRKNQLKRPQVANVDQVIITMAVKSPKPDLVLIDKLLMMASIANIKPIICINKADLGTQEEIDELKKQYDKYYDVYIVCCENEVGFDALKATFAGKINCFAGQSAVGKSSILNTIFKDFDLEVGGLSKKTERGKHTTRHAELILVEKGGIVVDTPGFSMLENMDIEIEQIGSHFQDIAAFKRQCKFSSCVHLNEPECAVKDAVEDGNIDQRRYDRYLKIMKEFKEGRKR